MVMFHCYVSSPEGKHLPLCQLKCSITMSMSSWASTRTVLTDALGLTSVHGGNCAWGSLWILLGRNHQSSHWYLDISGHIWTYLDIIGGLFISGHFIAKGCQRAGIQSTLGLKQRIQLLQLFFAKPQGQSIIDRSPSIVLMLYDSVSLAILGILEHNVTV